LKAKTAESTLLKRMKTAQNSQRGIASRNMDEVDMSNKWGILQVLAAP